MMQRTQKAESELLNFFEKSNAKKAIIGISGGVDSALTLAIAAKALGSENIIALCMPYKTGEISSVENLNDAQTLCSSYSIEYYTLPIDDFAKPYETLFSGMAFGNTLARIRMTLLFGFANTHNGIVLGTCNKTETMLGYETKFGDGAADVSVIGSLYKTEVWEWAKYYNLPEIFITKTPSAELYAGHTDEVEMGFSYFEADDILRQKAEGKKHEGELSEKIQKMIDASSHKRQIMPTLFY